MNEEVTATDRYRKLFTLFLLFCANLLNYLDRYIIFGVLIEIQRFYNLSNGKAGLLQTLFLVSYVSFSLFFGPVGDKTSRKYLIIIGLVIWSTFTLIGSFIPPKLYILFFCARSLVGVGEASISTIGFTVIGDMYTGKSRTRALSAFLIASPIGTGLGYMIGPQILKFTKNWQWTLRITPGFSIICALLLGIFMKEPERGEAEKRELKVNEQDNNQLLNPETLNSELESTNKSAFSNFLNDNIVYFTKRYSFIFSTLGFTCTSFVTGAFTVWVPKYLQLVNQHYVDMPGHLKDEHLVGLIFGVLALVNGILGVIIGGEVASFFRTRTEHIELIICVVCSLVSSVMVFLGIFMTVYNFFLTWLIIGIIFILTGCMWTPNNIILLLIIGPTHRSRASSIQILTIHALGDAISPLIIGLISDLRRHDNSNYWSMRSLQEALYITPFFMILAALFYAISMKHFQKDVDKSINETFTRIIPDTSNIQIET